MFLILVSVSPGIIYAQAISETIRQMVTFQTPGYAENTLNVYNIHGDVTIEGYDGDEVRIIAEKQVETRRESDAERAREELQLVIEELGNTVLVYMDAPFVQVTRRNGSISYNINRRNHDYDFLIEITIQVPERTNIQASTINNGGVTVKNVITQNLSASNVNGDVILEHVSGKTKATTVNGQIRARYNQSPVQDSEYKTVNGSIEVEYPADLSADIRFQSLHGDLYTDFENIERLGARVETGRGNHRGGTRWRIDKFSPLRIGNGGPEFQFQVVNGDVYLKRINS